ncbi:hypothetical protein HZS_4826, partial [Henneguya salminicola]
MRVVVMESQTIIQSIENIPVSNLEHYANQFLKSAETIESIIQNTRLLLKISKEKFMDDKKIKCFLLILLSHYLKKYDFCENIFTDKNIELWLTIAFEVINDISNKEKNIHCYTNAALVLIFENNNGAKFEIKAILNKVKRFFEKILNDPNILLNSSTNCTFNCLLTHFPKIANNYKQDLQSNFMRMLNSSINYQEITKIADLFITICLTKNTDSRKNNRQLFKITTPYENSWEALWDTHLSDLKTLIAAYSKNDMKVDSIFFKDSTPFSLASLTHSICIHFLILSSLLKQPKIVGYVSISIPNIIELFDILVMFLAKKLQQINESAHFCVLLNTILYFISIFSQIVETNLLHHQKNMYIVCLKIFQHSLCFSDSFLSANSLDTLLYIYDIDLFTNNETKSGLWALIEFDIQNTKIEFQKMIDCLDDKKIIIPVFIQKTIFVLQIFSDRVILFSKYLEIIRLHLRGNDFSGILSLIETLIQFTNIYLALLRITKKISVFNDDLFISLSDFNYNLAALFLDFLSLNIFTETTPSAPFHHIVALLNEYSYHRILQFPSNIENAKIPTIKNIYNSVDQINQYPEVMRAAPNVFEPSIDTTYSFSQTDTNIKRSCSPSESLPSKMSCSIETSEKSVPCLSEDTDS